MNYSIDPNIIALTSVIATALVSILSGFIPVFLDWLKSRREKRDEQLEQIKSTTLDLLKNLAPFRHTEYNDIKTSAGRMVVELHSDIQVAHYAWEQAVWPHLNEKEKERVKQLRSKFESVKDPKEYTKALQNISDEILQISRVASKSN